MVAGSNRRDRVLQKRIISNTLIVLFLAATWFCELVHASGLTSGQFRDGLVQGLLDLDQRSLRFCDGKLRGLTDSKGREILPAKYSDIYYCGHGIFLATDVAPGHRIFFGKQRHFFNSDGVELFHRVPTGAILLNVFSFGDVAEQDPNLELRDLPKETILLFGYQDRSQGLCDVKGTVLLPTIVGSVLFLTPGSAFVEPDGSRRSIVDLATMKASSTDLQPDIGKFPPPRLPQEHNYTPFSMRLPEDRVIKIVETDNRVFDKEYWLEKRTYPVSTEAMFNRFLTQYNLIGMPKNEVVNLLGAPSKSLGLVSGTVPGANLLLSNLVRHPDLMIYRFPSTGCVPFFFGVKICLEHDKVVSWFFVSEGKESEIVTTNVVLQVADGDRIVNARIGSPLRQQGDFPILEQKPIRK